MVTALRRRQPTAARIPSADARRRAFRSDVQGLRALAVGLVLLYHAGIPFVHGGYVGVDVFFVISGFLITGHLLESLERDGRVRLSAFYARRALRILPASFAVAALTAVAAVAVYAPLGLERVLKDALATVLYVPNVWFAVQNTDYLADHSPSPYQHYWSLGVEEQFYLLWPLALLLIFLAVRRSSRGTTWVVAASAVISLAACVILTPANQPVAFFLLPTRAWELLAGAIVAGLATSGRGRLHPAAAAVGGWVGIGLILVAAGHLGDTTPFPGTAAVLPVVGTALVIACGTGSPAGGPTAVLSLRPMQFVGLISYSLYLVHWPLLVLTQVAVGEHRPLPTAVTFAVGVIVAVPIAWVVFRFVETPLRSPRFVTERAPRVTLLGVAAVTMILASALWAAASWAPTRPVPSGPDVPARSGPPQSPPAAASVLPGNLTPSLEAAADDLPRLYADGCHNDVAAESVQDCSYGVQDREARIAVFGDSHAAQWFPALERYAEDRGDIAVDAYSKSSCPAVSVTVLDDNVPYASCDRWRAAVLAELVADTPDLVVISSFSHYPLNGVSERDRPGAWSAGLERTVRILREAGAQVLVIADTPRFQTSPTACIASRPFDVQSCSGERTSVLDMDVQRQEQAASGRAGAEFADLTDFICGRSTCPVIVDNLLVYRDVNHLTATYVEYLVPVLEPTLDRLLTGA